MVLHNHRHYLSMHGMNALKMVHALYQPLAMELNTLIPCKKYYRHNPVHKPKYVTHNKKKTKKIKKLENEKKVEFCLFLFAVFCLNSLYLLTYTKL